MQVCIPSPQGATHTYTSGDSADIWSDVITHELAFEEIDTLKVWMPWGRGKDGANWADPLLPSDGRTGWWNDTFKMGMTMIDAKILQNSVISEHISVYNVNTTHPGAVSSFSLISSPENLLAQGHVNMTAFPDGSGKLGFHKHFIRMQKDLVVSFKMHLVPHPMSGHSFRPGMEYVTSTYSEFFRRKNTNVKASDYEGMGSYSWYAGNITDPFYSDVPLKVNWDLSGKYFPYMGMFLPPIPANETWVNDAYGKQARNYSVSFAGISNQYKEYKEKHGVTSLSYFNYCEFGESLNCTRGVPTGKGDWNDSNSYCKGFLSDSLITESVSWKTGANAVQKGAINVNGAGSRLFDGGLPGYNRHVQEQLNIKMANLDTFFGIAVDRSDWCSVLSLQRDDGVTFLQKFNRTAANLQYTWLNTTAMTRNTFGKDYTLLINTVGYAWVPMMRHVDGYFSEGADVSALGLLAMKSTAVLWTYNVATCCTNDTVADTYFQRRLHLRVFPMAPFPGNDHSITLDSKGLARKYYTEYGQLFAALEGYEWSTDIANEASAPVGGSSGVSVNTFVNQALNTTLHSVMLGKAQTSVEVHITVLHTDVKGMVVMHPDRAGWKPLAGGVVAGTVLNITVPLVRGCALVKMAGA